MDTLTNNIVVDKAVETNQFERCYNKKQFRVSNL